MCFDLLFLFNIGKILVASFGLFLKKLLRISFISEVLKFSIFYIFDPSNQTFTFSELL